MSTMNDVLRVLLEESDSISGERLARRLGLSRNAVWKAVEQLRSEGYVIEAVTNRGYRLAEQPDRVSEPEIERWIGEGEIGRRLEVQTQLDSTNIRAKLLAAQGAQHICYLYDALTFSGTEKLAGYRASVSAAGLPDCSCRVAPGMQAARAQIETMLRSGTPIDAVLTAEDILAVGACKALTAAGQRCPVIGFNNSQLAACASPELTSVDNRLDDLCPAAADLLERVLAGEDAPHRTVLEAQLVERETFRTAE